MLLQSAVNVSWRRSVGNQEGVESAQQMHPVKAKEPFHFLTESLLMHLFAIFFKKNKIK